MNDNNNWITKSMMMKTNSNIHDSGTDAIKGVCIGPSPVCKGLPVRSCYCCIGPHIHICTPLYEMCKRYCSIMEI